MIYSCVIDVHLAPLLVVDYYDGHDHLDQFVWLIRRDPIVLLIVNLPLLLLLLFKSLVVNNVFKTIERGDDILWSHVCSPPLLNYRPPNKYISFPFAFLLLLFDYIKVSLISAMRACPLVYALSCNRDINVASSLTKLVF